MPRFDRNEIADAGLAAFFKIAQEWELSDREQLAVLGNPSQSRFFDLKRGMRSATLSDDELERLAYIAGIYAALNRLYVRRTQKGGLRIRAVLIPGGRK